MHTYRAGRRMTGPFAVIGRLDVDLATFDEDQLEHMVSVLRSTPGFVSGTWGRDVADGAAIHAVVSFATEAHAAEFVAGARAAVPGATFAVVEVLAEA